MKNFGDIEKQLEDIIATSCSIVEVEKQEEEKVETIEKLMAKRNRQLQALYQAEMNKKQLTETQKDTLRNFFTRFYVLDKKMNRFFGELSLHYKTSIQDIEYHKKARQAYLTDAPTSTLLNTQLSG
jgi:transcription termination factor NusB